MAILVIPTFAEYRFTEQVTLEGVTYTLAFDWSDFSGLVDTQVLVLDANGLPVVDDSGQFVTTDASPGESGEVIGASPCWHMDLLTEGGDPIRYGIKLVTDYPLLRHVSHVDRPPGELILIDMQGDAEPEFEGFGSRWLLMYAETGTVLT